MNAPPRSWTRGYSSGKVRWLAICLAGASCDELTAVSGSCFCALWLCTACATAAVLCFGIGEPPKRKAWTLEEICCGEAVSKLGPRLAWKCTWRTRRPEEEISVPRRLSRPVVECSPGSVCTALPKIDSNL